MRNKADECKSLHRLHPFAITSLNLLCQGKDCEIFHFKQGWTYKNYRNKAEMKTCKKTNLLWNNDGKEREEDYSISTAFLCFCHRSEMGSPLAFFITALFLYNTQRSIPSLTNFKILYCFKIIYKRIYHQSLTHFVLETKTLLLEVLMSML